MSLEIDKVVFIIITEILHFYSAFLIHRINLVRKKIPMGNNAKCFLRITDDKTFHIHNLEGMAFPIIMWDLHDFVL